MILNFQQHLNEKRKTKNSPDWHDSDAPDAKGKFRDLGIRKLAAWLIRTRKGDMRRITGSINQQIVFNRNEDPAYARKMEKVREEVKRQLKKESQGFMNFGDFLNESRQADELAKEMGGEVKPWLEEIVPPEEMKPYVTILWYEGESEYLISNKIEQRRMYFPAEKGIDNFKDEYYVSAANDVNEAMLYAKVMYLFQKYNIGESLFGSLNDLLSKSFRYSTEKVTWESLLPKIKAKVAEDMEDGDKFNPDFLKEIFTPTELAGMRYGV